MRLQIISTLVLTLAICGCDAPPPVRPTNQVTLSKIHRETELNARTTAEFSRSRKEDFVLRLQQQLNDLDAQIAELRTVQRALNDDALTQWDKEMVELEAKRDAAQIRLDEIRASGSAAWEELQLVATAACKNLEQAVRSARLRF
jgi:TolA-binding protein